MVDEYRILWINAGKHTDFEKIKLLIYGIFFPQVNWCDIDITQLEPIIQSGDIVIQELLESGGNEAEVFANILEYQPDILIFDGAKEYLNVKGLEDTDWNISYTPKMYVNDDKIGDTTSLYIISAQKLLIETNRHFSKYDSDKLCWYELKMAVKIWEEMR